MSKDNPLDGIVIHGGDDLVTTITPEQAEALLGTVGHNRRVRESKVREYMDDLENGRWNPYSVIRLTPEGRLQDGQHRLTACIRANTPIQAIVMRTSHEDVYTTDIGLKRSLGDQLKIQHPDVSGANEIAAVITAYYAWDQEEKDLTANRPSLPLAMELFNSDPEKFIEATYKARGIYGKLHRRNIPGSIAMIGAAYMVISENASDQEWVDAFFEEWRTEEYSHGDPLGMLDKAFAAMPDYGAFNNILGRRKALALVIKAWNAWATGDGPTRLVFNPGGPKGKRDNFPKIHPGPKEETS